MINGAVTIVAANLAASVITCTPSGEAGIVTTPCVCLSPRYLKNRLTGSIKQQLISHVHSVNTDIVMPDCHNIKHKLVRRFLGLRLQILAKKQVCLL